MNVSLQTDSANAQALLKQIMANLHFLYPGKALQVVTSVREGCLAAVVVGREARVDVCISIRSPVKSAEKCSVADLVAVYEDLLGWTNRCVTEHIPEHVARLHCEVLEAKAMDNRA